MRLVPCVPFAFLFRQACFHAFLPIPVLSFLLFLSPFAPSPHSGYHSSWPPVSSSAIPLCFRFRFRLLGLSVLNFSVRLRPRIYYHSKTILSTPIFCIFKLLCCTLLPIRVFSVSPACMISRSRFLETSHVLAISVKTIERQDCLFRLPGHCHQPQYLRIKNRIKRKVPKP